MRRDVFFGCAVIVKHEIGVGCTLLHTKARIHRARESAELTKHSQQRGGKRSEKRQDNPGICAEIDDKWTNLTGFLVLEMLFCLDRQHSSS